MFRYLSTRIFSVHRYERIHTAFHLHDHTQAPVEAHIADAV